jgi:ABC-type branched-subunit amino acid transport system permease subunit
MRSRMNIPTSREKFTVSQAVEFAAARAEAHWSRTRNKRAAYALFEELLRPALSILIYLCCDNRDLAESSGIDVDRVTLYVWFLGGGLASLGGVLFGLNQVVDYEMGFRLLLLMFAAVILGGLGTAYGAMVGGIAVGLVAMLSTLWFPTQLMQAWALALMILMLLVRPQGLLGRRERVG